MVNETGDQQRKRILRIENEQVFEPGGALYPRFESGIFEQFVGPLCMFVDPGAEYLLFSDVVNEVNVRFAAIQRESNTLCFSFKHKHKRETKTYDYCWKFPIGLDLDLGPINQHHFHVAFVSAAHSTISMFPR